MEKTDLEIIADLRAHATVVEGSEGTAITMTELRRGHVAAARALVELIDRPSISTGACPSGGLRGLEPVKTVPFRGHSSVASLVAPLRLRV